MARGRMLNNEISDSIKFQSLPDDTCRLLATWTIAHLDKNGVFHAEPALWRAKVAPWRDDISPQRAREYLDAMAAVGLIERFEEGGHVWQVWPGFSDNQPGLHIERERTRYPVPPNCRELPETVQMLPESVGLTETEQEQEQETEQEQNKNNNPTRASAPAAVPVPVLAAADNGNGELPSSRDLLVAFGVGEPALSKYAGLPSPFVADHIAYVETHRNVRSPVGLLVRRLELGVRSPPRSVEGDASRFLFPGICDVCYQHPCICKREE